MAGGLYAHEWYQWTNDGSDCHVSFSLLHLCCNIYRKRFHIYSRIVTDMCVYSHGRYSNDERRLRERQMDKRVSAMIAPIEPTLQKDEIEAVFRFLTELRADRFGEPVRYKDFVATSAHGLAALIMNRVADEWRALKRTHRLRSEPPWEAFDKWVSPKLPMSQELGVLMQLEYALARKVLLKEQRESQASNG